MAGFGENFVYGQSTYKDEHSAGKQDFLGIEPIIIVTFENRAYVLSHRSDNDSRREYRLTEYLKRGQYVDKFIFGA